MDKPKIPINNCSNVVIRRERGRWIVTNKSGTHIFQTFDTDKEATTYAINNMKEGFDSRLIVYGTDDLRPFIMGGLIRYRPAERKPVHMQMGANANGSGDLTAAQLKDLLEELPGEAVLHIRTDGDQRDGAYWSLRAEWGEEQHTSGSGSKIRNFSSPCQK